MQNRLREILLIDDSSGTNSLNKRLLIEMEVVEKVSVALNGAEAIDYLKTPNQNNTYPKPDIIFLDINMPVMDGYQFLDEISLLNENMKPNQIIMLSTSINDEDAQKSIKYPLVKGYMLKPLTKGVINQILIDILES